MTDCGHGWRSATDCDICTLERVSPQAAARIAELEAIIRAAKPALERYHAMMPGGPKKSDALALLNRARRAVPAVPDLYSDGVI